MVIGTGRLSALGHAGRAGSAGRSKGRDRGIGFEEQGPECGRLAVVGIVELRGL